MSADYWTLCTFWALYSLVPTTLKIGYFFLLSLTCIWRNERQKRLCNIGKLVYGDSQHLNPGLSVSRDLFSEVFCSVLQSCLTNLGLCPVRVLSVFEGSFSLSQQVSATEISSHLLLETSPWKVWSDHTKGQRAGLAGCTNCFGVYLLIDVCLVNAW